MIERERKFKIKYLPDNMKGQDIVQGYLMFDGRKHLRCRIIDNEYAYLTYKDIIDDETRKEFEYPIPLVDALELMSSCNFKLRKKRYTIMYNQDVFVSFDFVYEPMEISFVEVEFKDELTEIPPFCGEEITTVKDYTNIEIAKKNGKI